MTESWISDAERELEKLEKREQAIVGKYGTDIQKFAVSESTTESSGSSSTNPAPADSSKINKKDRFAAEEEWKEREEALNRIAYAKGEKDYLAYQQRMEQIEIEFNQKKLERTDLTETERLSIQAAYYEAVRKQADSTSKQTIEEEKKAYDEQLSVLKQRYIDGNSDLKTYQDAVKLLEMEHLRKLVSLYKEGSKEQIAAQKTLQDKLLADQKQRQQEAETAEKKHQQALAKMKEKYFGDNPSERQAKYAADLLLVTEIYQAEIRAAGDNAKEKLRIEKAYQKAKVALMEKYNIEGSDINNNMLQKWNNDVMKFLDSDM